MSTEFERLAARVATLEKKLGSDKTGSEELIAPEDKKEASQRDVLASEIAALEKRLAAEVKEDDAKEKSAAEVKAEDKKEDEKEVKAEDKKDDKKEDDKKASIVDPNGVEEQITQDRLHEVEDLEHGTELATGESMLDVAPTEYVAKLRNASSRLDAVADYLEKTGRKAEAMRIDRIADAIDSRIARFTK